MLSPVPAEYQYHRSPLELFNKQVNSHSACFTHAADAIMTTVKREEYVEYSSAVDRSVRTETPIVVAEA